MPLLSPSFIYCSSAWVSSAARGSSVSEEVQIKCPNLDGNVGCGSLCLWQLPGLAGPHLKPQFERPPLSIKGQSITGAGLHPGQARAPRGQYRGWLWCQRVHHQEEVTGAARGQVLGWEMKPPEVAVEEAIPKRLLENGHLPSALGSDVV